MRGVTVEDGSCTCDKEYVGAEKQQDVYSVSKAALNSLRYIL